MARPNRWRNTALTVRFFIFAAEAVIPLAAFLGHIKVWTAVCAGIAFLVFGVLERFGFSMRVALRLVRVRLAGPIRYAVAWWHKPQKKLY